MIPLGLYMAVGLGFEPRKRVTTLARFRGECIQPLCQPTIASVVLIYTISDNKNNFNANYRNYIKDLCFSACDEEAPLCVLPVRKWLTAYAVLVQSSVPPLFFGNWTQGDSRIPRNSTLMDFYHMVFWRVCSLLACFPSRRWSRELDLNQRPPSYGPGELPLLHPAISLVPRGRLERPTCGLEVRYSIQLS